MRYHRKEKDCGISVFGESYVFTNHPVCAFCTLYKEPDGRGLGVIQQYSGFSFDVNNVVGPIFFWGEIEDKTLRNDIYMNPNFKAYFDARAKQPVDGIYPIVTLRQIMHALKMKPLKKMRWETGFDRKEV